MSMDRKARNKSLSAGHTVNKMCGTSYYHFRVFICYKTRLCYYNNVEVIII